MRFDLHPAIGWTFLSLTARRLVWFYTSEPHMTSANNQVPSLRALHRSNDSYGLFRSLAGNSPTARTWRRYPQFRKHQDLPAMNLLWKATDAAGSLELYSTPALRQIHVGELLNAKMNISNHTLSINPAAMISLGDKPNMKMTDRQIGRSNPLNA